MPPDTNRGTGSRYAWYVVAILTLANVSGFMDRVILGYVLIPIENDLKVSDTQMSLLAGLGFAVFFSLLGIPVARWADRWNRRNIMAGGVTLWSVFTALCATATSYMSLLFMRMGVGVGEATLQAPSVSLLADYFPRERLSRAMSVYSLGIFLGSGLAYFIGGWIVGATTGFTLPLVGHLQAWQAAFLMVGLPGFVVALLFLTVREPARRNVDQAGRYLPFSVFMRYVAMNRWTYITHGLGFAFSATVNFALVVWIPAFFERTFAWKVQDIGRTQGLLTMTIGVAGVIVGGSVADRFVRQGHVDGPLRVGIIGAVGMLISATAFPLMSNATEAVIWLAVVNFFAAFPWGAAAAAAAEMAPTPLRAQGAALYFFGLNLISQTAGPTTVALFTDHVFGKENIRYSLAAVNVIGMSMAIVLLWAGRGAYRRTLEFREHWSPES